MVCIQNQPTLWQEPKMLTWRIKMASDPVCLHTHLDFGGFTWQLWSWRWKESSRNGLIRFCVVGGPRSVWPNKTITKIGDDALHSKAHLLGDTIMICCNTFLAMIEQRDSKKERLWSYFTCGPIQNWWHIKHWCPLWSCWLHWSSVLSGDLVS